MNMEVSIAIMSHIDRSNRALELYNALKDQGFKSVSLITDQENNEWDNGRKCWDYLSYSGSKWSVVIQDDAIISNNFYDNLVKAIKSMPENGLLSLYTGTVRPYRSSVLLAVQQAKSENASFLRSNRLHWGVAVVMRTDCIKPVLEATEGLRDLYDVRLGKGARKVSLPVFYTNPSLVDHDNSIGSIVGTTSKEPRVAHWYYPDIYDNWNSKYIDMTV